MGMVAWLIIGAGMGWLLASRDRRVSQPETVMAVAVGVVGALLGGLAAGFVIEGQVDLDWQPSGLVGAALGALLVQLWLRLDTR